MLQYWRVYILVLLLLLVGFFRVYGIFSNAGYEPEQPLPFSHALHAGALKIQCLYCHTNAERSQHATVPPLKTCMGCHSVVKTDSPYIRDLTKHYNENKPIEWVRVHRLPDHAHFSHQWHVAAGVTCQTCHGPVEEMVRIRQVQKLEMRTCMKCHRREEYTTTVDHPETYQDGGLDLVKDSDIKELKADDAAAWTSMAERTRKTLRPDQKLDDRMIAANLLFQRDLYYHGREAQLRSNNASTECVTCHH